jgi:hypothetical protein
VYHHNPFWRLYFWCLFISEGGPTPPQCPVTFCSPVDDPTTHLSIFSSLVSLNILPDVLSFPRCSCCLAPWSFISLLYSGSLHPLFWTLGSAGAPLAKSSLVHFLCEFWYTMAHRHFPVSPLVLR